MNKRKSYFRTFSVLIEEYSIELFIFEALVLVLAFHSLTIIKYMALAIPLAIFVSEAMKLVIKENRPPTAMERSYFKRSGSRLKIRSFPSTHSSVAMAFAAAFYYTPAFIPLFVFAVVIMYSRVYIKSHYLRDVLAGGMIGLLIGYSVTFLL